MTAIPRIRQIQQELLNAGSCASGTATAPGSVEEGHLQVDKIQDLLRVRLSELKTKRDHVRSLGKNPTPSSPPIDRQLKCSMQTPSIDH